jgi:hypothetical protein
MLLFFYSKRFENTPAIWGQKNRSHPQVKMQVYLIVSEVLSRSSVNESRRENGESTRWNRVE